MVACRATYGRVMAASHLHLIMTAQDYIQTKLKALKEPIEFQALEPEKLEGAILAKVLSKKFRKYAADQAAIEVCKRAIHSAVTQKKPIKIGLLFGGNKIWRINEAPEVDWAELFSLEYFTRWMRSIRSVYEHGVEFSFYSQDVSIERLNNVPRSETDNYSRSFRELLDWFQQYLPEGVSFTYGRHAEEYKDLSEYDVEIEEAKKSLFEELGGKYPEMTDAEKKITEFNVKLKDGQSDDPEWHRKVELEHQAIFRTKTLVPYLEDESIIRVSAMPFTGYIAVGSTKYSVAKFWASAGVLQKSGDKYLERALTPTQLDSIRFEWQEIDLGIQGKNFGRIRVAREAK